MWNLDSEDYCIFKRTWNIKEYTLNNWIVTDNIVICCMLSSALIFKTCILGSVGCLFSFDDVALQWLPPTLARVTIHEDQLVGVGGMRLAYLSTVHIGGGILNPHQKHVVKKYLPTILEMCIAKYGTATNASRRLAEKVSGLFRGKAPYQKVSWKVTALNIHGYGTLSLLLVSLAKLSINYASWWESNGIMSPHNSYSTPALAMCIIDLGSYMSILKLTWAYVGLCHNN